MAQVAQVARGGARHEDHEHAHDERRDVERAQVALQPGVPAAGGVQRARGRRT